MADKKAILALLMRAKPEEGGDEGDGSDDYAAAGDSIHEAIKSGDGAAIAGAICDLIDIHLANRDGGDDEEAEGEKY